MRGEHSITYAYAPEELAARFEGAALVFSGQAENTAGLEILLSQANDIRATVEENDDDDRGVVALEFTWITREPAHVTIFAQASAVPPRRDHVRRIRIKSPAGEANFDFSGAFIEDEPKGDLAYCLVYEDRVYRLVCPALLLAAANRTLDGDVILAVSPAHGKAVVISLEGRRPVHWLALPFAPREQLSTSADALDLVDGEGGFLRRVSLHTVFVFVDAAFSVQAVVERLRMGEHASS